MRLFPFLQDKFGEFRYKDDKDPTKKLHEEGIQYPRKQRVVVTKNCTFVVLVCIDCLLHSVLDLLTALGIGLVLIPSFSPELVEYETHARSLAVRNQAITAVANTATRNGGSVAVFARPRRRDGWRTVPHPQHAPALVTYDIFTGTTGR